MRTMKLTVMLIAGFLILAINLPASAQEVTVDALTLDRIEFHMNKALEAINKPNYTKATNHINWALGLLNQAPTGSQPPGSFVFTMPFVWHQSSGPMAFRVVAMLGDGTPQPNWFGSVRISLVGYGAQIVQIYDETMQPLTGTVTPHFTGSWGGYITLRTASGQTESLGLSATDLVSGIQGNGHGVIWTVP